MDAIMTVDALSYDYHTLSGETKAIDDISFSVDKGEFVSVVGPSGCGKSTLLSLIAGLLDPTLGKVGLLTKSSDTKKYLIGYMLQKDHLFEWRTIYQNVCLGLEVAKQKTPSNLEYIESLLKKYGLFQFRNYKPSQLSGGMRQRAALIRTLALKPDILLLDEPFSALDYQTRLKVADDMYDIIKGEQKTAILVTHDIAEAISMADRVIVLTSRPAKIKNIFSINFNIERRTPFLSRGAKSFGDYFNIIWKEMDSIE